MKDKDNVIYGLNMIRPCSRMGGSQIRVAAQLSHLCCLHNGKQCLIPAYEARYGAEYRFFEILVNMVNAVNVVNVVNMVIGVFFFMFSLLSPDNLLVNMVNMVNVVNMVNMLCTVHQPFSPDKLLVNMVNAVNLVNLIIFRQFFSSCL